jgi:hypothetical protein
MIIKLLECLNMAAIAYQDFRYRAIHWFLFLSLAFLLVLDGLNSHPANQYGLSVIFNIILILLQFTILFLFYHIRGRSIRSLLNTTIGSGDIIFIFSLSLAFSWQNFLFYYIGAMIFSILAWLILRTILHPKSELIPFAGLMSVFCFILFLIELMVPGFTRFSNDLFMMIFNG